MELKLESHAFGFYADQPPLKGFNSHNYDDFIKRARGKTFNGNIFIIFDLFSYEANEILYDALKQFIEHYYN